jgi:hypothetical protein
MSGYMTKSPLSYDYERLFGKMLGNVPLCVTIGGINLSAVREVGV